MTNLVYRLNDGTRVKTMREAKASGQPYKVEYEPIPEFNTSTPGKYVGKFKGGRAQMRHPRTREKENVKW